MVAFWIVFLFGTVYHQFMVKKQASSTRANLTRGYASPCETEQRCTCYAVRWVTVLWHHPTSHGFHFLEYISRHHFAGEALIPLHIKWTFFRGEDFRDFYFIFHSLKRLLQLWMASRYRGWWFANFLLRFCVCNDEWFPLLDSFPFYGSWTALCANFYATMIHYQVNDQKFKNLNR